MYDDLIQHTSGVCTLVYQHIRVFVESSTSTSSPHSLVPAFIFDWISQSNGSFHFLTNAVSSSWHRSLFFLTKAGSKSDHALLHNVPGCMVCYTDAVQTYTTWCSIYHFSATMFHFVRCGPRRWQDLATRSRDTGKIQATERWWTHSFFAF